MDYVRDREDAEIHVLVTTQPSGSDGVEFSINFIGRERFAESEEVVLYFSSQTDTADEVRDGLTRTLKMALLRYVAETAVAEQIQIFYSAPQSRLQ